MRTIEPLRRPWLMLALLGAALALAACGGDGETTQPASPSGEEPPPTADPQPAVALPAEAVAGARFTDSVTLPDGSEVRYTAVLPEAFQPGATHPVLLAFPPGAQQQGEVEFGLARYWATEARQRGWIVLSPIPPEGLFIEESASLVPDLVAALSELYPPEGGAMHVGGISNGGISSFRAAIDNPELFASVIVLPGFPPQEDDYAKLDRLAGVVPVTLYVGENDDGWVEAAQRTEQTLAELGGEVSLTIAPDEGHIIASLTGAELFDVLDANRPAS